MKDYNNPLDQMKAISWQLKRIADVLESQFGQKVCDPKENTYTDKEDNTSLREFMRSLQE